MNISIDKYKITSDGMCVTLWVKKTTGENSKEPGVEIERAIGYFPNLENCLMRVLEEKIAEVGAVDAQELAQEIRAAKLEIVAAVRVWGCEK